jgi:hypothetical protein
MKQILGDALVLLWLANAVLGVASSTAVPFPFALTGENAATPTSHDEFDIACEKFLSMGRVADPHFFMQHCVGGTGVQCEGWLTALVRQFSKSQHLSKAMKKEWCTTVFDEMVAEHHAQQEATTTTKPSVAKQGKKSDEDLTHAANELYPNASNFVAAHASKVTYKLEVHGQNCGLRARGSHIINIDDAAECREKCTANKDCLAYTTYDSDCALKCLHYSHACNKMHQATTQCTGEIVSYSKVVTPVDSLPAETRRQSIIKNRSSTNATSAVASKANWNADAAHDKTWSAPSKGNNMTLHNQSIHHASSAKTAVERPQKVTSEPPMHTVGLSSHTQSPMVSPDANMQGKHEHAALRKTASPPASKSIEKVTKSSTAKSSGNMATKVLAKKAQASLHAVKEAKDKEANGDIVLPTAEAAVKDIKSSRHKSWKDFLPKANAVSKVVASSTNSSKNCACVHRHGKKVCHCLGEKEKDVTPGSVTHSQ